MKQVFFCEATNVVSYNIGDCKINASNLRYTMCGSR